MKWDIPPIIKIYEALGCIADARLEIDDKNIKVYSSSRGKFYTVQYDSGSNSVMCNDNASFYVGYLGYPAIAYLMTIGELSFSREYSEALQEIYWKDLNQQYKNDFKKSQRHIDEMLKKKGVDLDEFRKYLEKVLEQIKVKEYNLLGEKERPPQAY